MRRSLFQPFHKSASEAAVTAPGVGLGLALCRRLARDMGGDLRLDDRITDGAGFVIDLPLLAVGCGGNSEETAVKNKGAAAPVDQPMGGD